MNGNWGNGDEVASTSEELLLDENSVNGFGQYRGDFEATVGRLHSSQRSRAVETHVPMGVIFAGRNSLDFLELRQAVVRIPEVSLRLREAQRIFDRAGYTSVDLLGAIVSDDETFFKNIKFKALLATIVQVGLYDRMRKTQRAPDVLIGCSNGDSAVLVCSGQIAFDDMIRESEALKTLKPDSVPENPATLSLVAMPAPVKKAPTEPVGLPSLSGMSLTEYRAFVRTEDGGLAEVGQPTMDLKRLVGEVAQERGITRLINVGPAQVLAGSDLEVIADQVGVAELTMIDSIDLDPMLSWFWRQVKAVTVQPH